MNNPENIKSDKKICLLVLGMHRSGTSALTGVLNILGANLGENLLVGGADNIKGYFENTDFLEINEEILRIFKMEWDSLLHLPKGWEKNEKVHSLKEEIKKKIKKTFDNGYLFLIKDPRMLTLFPVWEDVLNSFKFQIKIIFVIRYPMEVALSLQKRDGMSLEKGLILFSQQILTAEAVSRDYERVVVPFDDLLNDTLNTLAKIKEQLKIKFPYDLKDKQEEIYAFLNKDLKHHNVKNKPLKHLQIAFDIYDIFETLKFKKIAKKDCEKIDNYNALYNEKYGKITEALSHDHDHLLQNYYKLLYEYNTLIETYNEKQSSIRNAILIILSRTIGRIPILGNMARSIWKVLIEKSDLRNRSKI